MASPRIIQPITAAVVSSSEKALFDQRLLRVAEALKAHLTRLDEEANWSDDFFMPLDVEVEILKPGNISRRVQVDLVQGCAKHINTSSLLILGDPGSGKSAALRHLTRLMLTDVAQTGVLPLYINLRQWSDSSRNLEVSADEGLLAFARKFYLERVNDLVGSFVSEHFDAMLAQGRIALVFDSFDEIPVLLDNDDATPQLQAISRQLEDIARRPVRIPLIIASRYFRRPRFRSVDFVVFDLQPFSDQKIVQTLSSRSGVTRVEIDRFLGDGGPWLKQARNPFTVNLILDYMSRHQGGLPNTVAELYRSYLTARLYRVSDRIVDAGRTVDQVMTDTELVARSMIEGDAGGLEGSIKAVQAIHSGVDVRVTVDLLERARLVRRAVNNPDIFTFVHRRFNEYFVARHMISSAMPPSLDVITGDRKERDALVIYTELCDDMERLRVLRYCLAFIDESKFTKLTSEEESCPDDSLVREIRALRFIEDAFGRMPERLPEDARKTIDAYISKSAYAGSNRDLLRAKLALEILSLSTPLAATELLKDALSSGNVWLVDTAMRSFRYAREIGDKAEMALIRAVRAMPASAFARAEPGLAAAANGNFSFLKAPIFERNIQLIIGYNFFTRSVLFVDIIGQKDYKGDLGDTRYNYLLSPIFWIYLTLILLYTFSSNSFIVQDLIRSSFIDSENSNSIIYLIFSCFCIAFFFSSIRVATTLIGSVLILGIFCYFMIISSIEDGIKNFHEYYIFKILFVLQVSVSLTFAFKDGTNLWTEAEESRNPKSPLITLSHSVFIFTAVVAFIFDNYDFLIFVVIIGISFNIILSASINNTTMYSKMPIRAVLGEFAKTVIWLLAIPSVLLIISFAFVYLEEHGVFERYVFTTVIPLSIGFFASILFLLYLVFLAWLILFKVVLPVLSLGARVLYVTRGFFDPAIAPKLAEAWTQKREEVRLAKEEARLAIANYARRQVLVRQLLENPSHATLVNRAEIATALAAFFSAGERLTFIERLAAYHLRAGTMPMGQWPEGRVPNYDDDASTRLAQLDERWRGLDR